jgi:hypothetical protein
MTFPEAPPGRLAALIPSAIVGAAFLLFAAPPLFAAILAFLVWLRARGEME